MNPLAAWLAATIPAQPAHPWGTAWLAFADSVRVAACLAGCADGLLAGVYLVGWRGTRTSRLVCAALIMLSASAVGTEYQHIGTTVTYRLWCNVIGVVFAVTATVLFLRRDPVL